MEEHFQIDGVPVSAAVLRKVPTLLHYPVQTRRFCKGQTVIHYQEPIRELQFLVEGRAKVFTVMENGRAVLHTMFQDFEVIGDLELLSGYPLATTNILALTDVLLLVIPLDSCREQLWKDASMLRLLGEELAKKLERSSKQSAQNLLYPLSARLAAYLLFSVQDGIFAENLTHVSELMATSYRHLLRTLKSFCEMGAIRHTSQGYLICDAQKLTAMGKNLL